MVYTREWMESAIPGGRWQSNGEYLCAIRDERTPSCRINLEKRTYCDFGGSSGKLSALLREMNIPDPYQNEKGAAQAAPAPHSQEAENAIIQRQAARQIWEQATGPDGHEYLSRKGVDAHGARRMQTVTTWSNKEARLKTWSADVLVVPSFAPDGSLIGIEQIDGGGTKYALGSKGFFVLGDVDKTLPCVVCEGFSTAASVKALTGWNTVAAFGYANLEKTGKALRQFFPEGIAIAPDAGSKEPSDDIDVVEIPGDRPKNTDWNDIVSEIGLEITKQLFRDAWQARRKVEKPAEKPKRSILDLVKSPSPGTAVKPEKVWQFPRKHLNLVAADSGMGKSLLITKVCCDLSVGAPVLETTSEPIRKTLYLNGECGRDYFDWRISSSGWKYSEEYFKVLHQEDLAEDGIDLDLDTPQGRKNLEILLDGIGPDLLVIDSLPAFSNEDLNDGTVQNEIGKYLKQLAIKYNLSLVLITHLRKRRLQDQSTEPTLSEIQGSNAAAKLCNVALAVFEKVVEIGGEERTVKVCKSVKSWGKQVAPFGFCFPELDEDTLVIEMVDLPRSKQLTGSWERVRDALKHTEFNRQAVESILGVSERTAKKLLSDWKQQGKIESIGRGPKTAYLVRNGQTVPTLSISAPIRENPVIASIESVHLKCTDTGPQEGNLSVQNTCTDSNPVISMNDDVSVQYIDGGVPIGAPIENQVVKSVQSPSCGNLERFNLPMNRTKEKARQEFFALLDEGVEVDCLTGKPMSEIEASLPCGPSQAWLESQPETVKALYSSKLARLNAVGIPDAEQLALLRTFEEVASA